jgi:hypothetical protein
METPRRPAQISEGARYSTEAAEAPPGNIATVSCRATGGSCVWRDL